MAKVIWTPGNEGPVNPGERKVLELLQSGLPDTFEIYPNIEVSVDNGELKECDAVVLGPDCVWLIETKDIYGKVAVLEHEFAVNNVSRGHPVKQTRKKAQQIKSRVSNDPNLTGIWIQPLVVFSRVPQELSVSPIMKPFVSLADESPLALNVIDLLLDPTTIGLRRNRLSQNQRDRFKAQLNLHLRARRFRPTYGSYSCVDLLDDKDDTQWWNAEHTLLGTRVVLEVIRLDPILPPNERDKIRASAIKEARVRAKVGQSVFLLLPNDALISDDGSIVIVHSADSSATLDELEDDVRDWPDGKKRRLIWCIATAVDRLHSSGIIHRTIGPGCIYVSGNDAAKLGGLSTAGFKGGTNRTLGRSDWGGLGREFFSSPEHNSGNVSNKSDIYALGLLVQYLWPKGIPQDLQELVNLATALDPDDRVITAKDIALKCQSLPAKTLAAPPDLDIGVVLEGRYQLIERIGRGASSEVWHAEDLHAQGHVALKFFLNAEAGESAQHEYQALSDIIHPGIVRVIDFREIAGRWALISKYLEGPTLRLAMPPFAPAPSLEQAVSAAVEILSALKAIHPNMQRIVQLVDVNARTEEEEMELTQLRASGIAHRDVKPENIILVDGHRPVLVDFGLAASGSIGEEGGTIEYRPAGVALNSADPDVDLFAVGIILHEMLTGRHPYLNSDPSSRELLIDESLDGNLKRVLRRACAVRVAERFHSADEFIGALLSLHLKAIPLPEPPMDIKAKMDEVMAEVIAEHWEEALWLCPEEWTPLREQILRRKERAELIAEAQPLLSHDGFDLRFVGIDSFESAQSAGTDTVGPGIVRIYRVSGPMGEVLDIGYFISDCGTRWVATVDVYETQYPLKRLGQGLRLGIRDHGEQLVAELAQAQINSDNLWSNCYKADTGQLNSGAGVDADALFQTHGATRFGTKEAILGDTSNRRKYLCSTFPQSAVDLPAVLYLVTRILPLARGVRNQ